MARILARPLPAFAPVAAPIPGQPLSISTLAMYLNSGGDERIKPDPLTGRTRYGTTAAPAEDEIWFSSSTASSPDPRSFAAAGEVLSRLIGGRSPDDRDVKSWFDRLRTRISDVFAIAGTEVVLTASGTEAEFVALSVAQALLERPLTNIVVAPTETGKGVMTAAEGRHFLPSSALGGAVANGAALHGFDGREIEVKSIAIRDEDGHRREAEAIDRDAATLVVQALEAGRDVLLHVLDASKTGLTGITRETARELARQARGRIAIVVDACQLRCQPAQLQQDLESGFMVMITGSKFAGGPPFTGALMLSPSTVERLENATAPSGLSAYSARFDWPECLRENFAADLDQPMNMGVGLRWEAALAAIEPYFALPEGLRQQILTWFSGTVHRRVSARPHLKQISGEPSRAKTIIPIETLGQAGTPSGAAALYAILAAPRAPMGAPDRLAKACHLGQPVCVGARVALRLCASMPMVLDVAARIMEGQAIDSAVTPVVNDLDLVFEKWDWLATN
ncbi:MAG TPA: hypothetical protein VGG12_08910 [Methylovirgula sp.]